MSLLKLFRVRCRLGFPVFKALFFADARVEEKAVLFVALNPTRVLARLVAERTASTWPCMVIKVVS